MVGMCHACANAAAADDTTDSPAGADGVPGPQGFDSPPGPMGEAGALGARAYTRKLETCAPSFLRSSMHGQTPHALVGESEYACVLPPRCTSRMHSRVCCLNTVERVHARAADLQPTTGLALQPHQRGGLG